jgi:NADH-ubiquinone oxidoreductase chain 4
MFFFLVFWGYRPERLQASFYMVFYTLLVSLPFLVFLFLVGDFFSGCFFFVSGFFGYWWVFLFLVFMVKLPVYGVHL